MAIGAPENQPSDEALAQTAGRREDAQRRPAANAFEELYLRHARKLLAFLAARVSPSDLEDIHQSIWERIWQHLPKGFQGGNFRAWLYQVARNYLIDLSRKKRPERLDDDAALADPRRVQPDDMLIEEERRRTLQRCLEHLTAEAAALVKGRLAGESYQDICQRIDVRPERAHKLFHQAKEQLQDCVGQSL